MPRSVLLLGLAAAQLLLVAVEGHGFVEEPRSRVYECRRGGRNKRCTVGTWTAVQTNGRYPEKGPIYGIIASAGMSAYRQLDEQGEDRWWKNRIRPGPFTFKWNLPANHITRDFQYWITEPGWNPNLWLSKNSFGAKPFCEVNGNYKVPPRKSYHKCVIPERKGYHVILAMWDVGDNTRSFYNVIDVDFSGNGGGGGGKTAVPLPSLQNYNNRGKHQVRHNKNNQYIGQGKSKSSSPRGGIGLPPMPKRGSTGKPAPKPMPMPRPAPEQKKCEVLTDPASNAKYQLCKGNEKCCPKGTKCFAANSAYSLCMPTCPTNWDCNKGSRCPAYSGYNRCDGEKGCCPKDTKCYAYNNQLSVCMVACPKGWKC